MSALENPTARNLRRFAHVFRRTLLHPQWLAFRFKGNAARRVIALVDGDVLDIGCADGALRLHLRATARYVGLDYPATTHLYNTRPSIYGDAQNLPFSAAAFDHIVLLDVLEHLPRPEECLAEAARVLRPGGQVLIHIPFAYPLHDRPFDFWRVTEHGLHALAKRAGMQARSVEACGHAIETSGLLLNLALTQSLISASRHFAPLLLLGLLLLPAVAAINALCWVLARLSPTVSFLPVSYWAVLVRPGDSRAI